MVRWNVVHVVLKKKKKDFASNVLFSSGYATGWIICQTSIDLPDKKV
jgi:hypothetical protein